MHVVVIGAGVIGVTTAYYLSQQGCEVTVVDREHDVANGASLATADSFPTAYRRAWQTRIYRQDSGADRGQRPRLENENCAGTGALGFSLPVAMHQKACAEQHRGRAQDRYAVGVFDE